MSIQSDRLTACLVVHNEETVIRRCLESLLRVTSRCVVVHDGPCSDRTLDICRDFHCDVFERDFVGMCEGHRAWVYSIVETEWILQIDADEFLSDELIQHIPELVNDKDVACYEFVWPYWDGSRYRTTNWPYKRALFRKNCIEYLAFPHEEVRPVGQLKRTPYRIEHRPSYDNYAVANLFRKHWKWIRIHAAFHLKARSELDRFPPTATELVPHYSMIGTAPLLAAPLVFGYHFAGMLLLGGAKAGWIGMRNAFMQSLYYLLVCLNVRRMKYRSRS